MTQIGEFYKMWTVYEEYKKRIQKENLTPDEYEKRIKEKLKEIENDITK